MSTRSKSGEQALPKQERVKARSIRAIALEIDEDWRKQKNGVYYAARPYLTAMLALGTMKDAYYSDDAEGIVLRFLGNASTYRGPTARRCKAELRELLKQYQKEERAMR